jgi:hypothetical protein
LGLTGGTDVGETTRRVLVKVFTNNVAKQLNWKGRGEKIGVATLGIIGCVKGNF